MSGAYENADGTIAAIASGMTASGIGIIRISGPEAFSVCEKVFRPASGSVQEFRTNTIHYGHIVDGGEVLDECLVMIMKGPHTFTTEDTVEIDCHGGPFVMQNILMLVLRSGARLAEPGEFTKRAFLGGRIDLTEAEAVMDVISAGSRDALRSSISQLSGSLKNEIRALRRTLLDEISFIEAALDDPEHYEMEGYGTVLLKKLQPVRQRLQELSATYSKGRLVKEGIRTVILGKPNAGKSSLLNALTGSDRAIVTDIEGTTRDVLEERVNLGGILLRVCDTAGIREAKDRIEEIGISRAKEYAKDADLLLAVFDSSEALDENDREILALLEGRQAVVLLNKSDLVPVTDEEELRKALRAKGSPEIPVIRISAKSGTGLDRLEEIVRKMFFAGNLHFNEQVLITNSRHYEEIRAALSSLDLVRESVESGMTEDFYTIDLMDAYRHLGNMIGEETGDDLIDNIFAKFCMGK